METDVTVLAQASPGATSETVWYSVPAGNRAFINGFLVCNRSASDQSFRISVSLTGAATANKDYVYYDLPIKANDTFLAQLEFSIGPLATLRIYASSSDLSFTLFGIA